MRSSLCESAFGELREALRSAQVRIRLRDADDAADRAAEALLGGGARRRVVAVRLAARRGGGLDHRALVLGVGGHRRGQLRHEVGAAPELRVDVAPGRGEVRLRAEIRRLSRSTTATATTATTAAAIQISTPARLPARCRRPDAPGCAPEQRRGEAGEQVGGLAARPRRGAGLRSSASHATMGPADRPRRRAAPRARPLRGASPSRSPSAPSSSGTCACSAGPGALSVVGCIVRNVLLRGRPSLFVTCRCRP